MAFNLDGKSHDEDRVVYFPHTTGIDRCGNEANLIVCHDPTASGCNPFYWTVSPHNRYGHEFSSQVEAETIAKHAAGSWSVKSIDINDIKIGAVRIITSRKEINLGDVA